MNEFKFQIAEYLVRTIAGILFFFQGYDKIFKVKMSGVINAFMGDAGRHHVPPIIVKISAYYTSIAEFLGGILLILGLFTNYALYALGLDLIIVCFAFSMIEPIWDMKFVFPRLVLICILLLMPSQTNAWSLDCLLDIKTR